MECKNYKNLNKTPISTPFKNHSLIYTGTNQINSNACKLSMKTTYKDQYD